MIIERLKERALAASKAKDAVARDVLRLALGEIQTAEARSNRPATDDEALAVVRKLIKSNQETAAASGDEEQKRVLAQENEVLASLLPASLTPEAIAVELAPLAEALRAAKSDGQATGLAMKHLKAAGLAVTGNDVTAAVKTLRSPG